MTLKELQKLIHSPIIIGINFYDQYYAKLDYVEVKANNCLSGVYGRGETINEALASYCKELSNKEIAVRAYQQDRIDLYLPEITLE